MAPLDPRALLALSRSLRDGAGKADEKASIVKSPSFEVVTEEGVSLKEQMRMMGVTRKPVRTRLVYSFSQSSGAGTALNFAQRIRPGDSSEFASFAALYDEYKCLGATVLHHFAASAYPGNIDFAACYDVTGSLLSSVADAIAAEQHTYFNTGASTGGTVVAWPLSVSKDGHLKQRIRIPKGVVAVAGAVVDGAWISTSDSTTDFGYWKGISTAGGGAIILTSGGHLIMDVEFRMRS